MLFKIHKVKYEIIYNHALCVHYTIIFCFTLSQHTLFISITYDFKGNIYSNGLWPHTFNHICHDLQINILLSPIIEDNPSHFTYSFTCVHFIAVILWPS